MRSAPMIALLAIMPLLAAADDSSVYESVENIDIGRVFLSPNERRLLDEQRAAVPPAKAASSAPPIAAVGDDDSRREQGAGYILRGDGKPRRWRDGEFVSVEQGAELAGMEFPGDVRVVRHAPAEKADEQDDEE